MNEKTERRCGGAPLTLSPDYAMPAVMMAIL